MRDDLKRRVEELPSVDINACTASSLAEPNARYYLVEHVVSLPTINAVNVLRSGLNGFHGSWDDADSDLVYSCSNVHEIETEPIITVAPSPTPQGPPSSPPSPATPPPPFSPPAACLQRGSFDDPSSLNPIFFAVFNALGVIPAINAALLFPGSKDLPK